MVRPFETFSPGLTRTDYANLRIGPPRLLRRRPPLYLGRKPVLKGYDT
jgi:hypothetical protein